MLDRTGRVYLAYVHMKW